MVTIKRSILFGILIGSLLMLSPIRVRSFQFTGNGWQTASLNLDAEMLLTENLADLDGNGILENIEIVHDQLTLESNGKTVWTSPDGWQVEQALISDLDRDGLEEMTLLVRRPFQPWPVDRWLPYGKRIAEFQDPSGNSCHIILIGWKDGRYKELWAGSSMSQPALQMAVADLNRDGIDELITLEGTYNPEGIFPGKAIKVWEWNGFGFSLLSGLPGNFNQFKIFKSVFEENNFYIIAY